MRSIKPIFLSNYWRYQMEKDDLARIIESAKRLGVELDEADALQWMTAMAAAQSSQEVSIDVQSGVFGHKVAMLDFNPQDLARFREIGKLVGFADQPGVVETALALSGSSAQSKIQTYPGDCDYFRAGQYSRGQPRRGLPDTGEADARQSDRKPERPHLPVDRGQIWQLSLRNVVIDGRTIKAGSPVAWTAAQVVAGQIDAFTPDGTPAGRHLG